MLLLFMRTASNAFILHDRTSEWNICAYAHQIQTLTVATHLLSIFVIFRTNFTALNYFLLNRVTSGLALGLHSLNSRSRAHNVERSDFPIKVNQTRLNLKIQRNNVDRSPSNVHRIFGHCILLTLKRNNIVRGVFNGDCLARNMKVTMYANLCGQHDASRFIVVSSIFL